MISAEILIIVIVGLAAITLYSMYRYFEERYACSQEQLDCIDKNMNDLIDAHNKATDIWNQKLKDGLQNNAICHKSAIEQLKKEQEQLRLLYEGKREASRSQINVLIPEIKKEQKSHPKKGN